MTSFRPVGLSVVCGFFLLVGQATPAAAEEREITASNGIVVSLYADDFAEHYEYSAPMIYFYVDGEESFMIVAKIKSAGVLGKLNVQGTIYYEDDWRGYSRAIFKGGTPAKFTSGGRDVVTCAGGDSCTLSETFMIHLASSDVAKHAKGGTLQIQVRAPGHSGVLLEIPMDHVDAVNEVAK